MTRALLLAALAVPALVQAQTAGDGEILFAEGDNDVVRGRWISKAECDAATTTDVELTWNVAFLSGASLPASGTYQVYAANQAHPSDACHTAPNTTTGLVAGSVGSAVTVTSEAQTQVYKVSPFLTALSLGCNPSGDTTIFVCVLGSTTTAPFGQARGTLTLSVATPGSPTGVGTGPGDGSLRVTWTRPTSAPEAYDYRVVAKSVVAGCPDPANPDSTCSPDPLDVTTHQETSGIRANELDMTGLVNDVLYRVEVYARSEAGNENGTPGTSTGTPVPTDGFWDYYRNQPGAQEEGGCGAGRGGTLALAAVAGLLAVLRRRK